MKKSMRENGITLIALVITIIVLLILASVSIAMLTGNNGILTQAKNAKQATAEAAQRENEDLLELIATTLLEEETITKEQIDSLVKTGHLPNDDTKTVSKEKEEKESE